MDREDTEDICHADKKGSHKLMFTLMHGILVLSPTHREWTTPKSLFERLLVFHLSTRPQSDEAKVIAIGVELIFPQHPQHVEIQKNSVKFYI